MEIRAHTGSAGGAAVLAALSLMLLVACGGSNTPSPIEVTPQTPKGETVEVAVGDTVIVSLDANATTGYSWEFTAGDTFAIVSSEYVPDPNQSGMAGSAGTQVVTLKVTKVGSSELTGVYSRSWETPAPSTPTFSMTVTGTE